MTSAAGHDVDHVLLTRFNLPSAGAESYIRAADGWLRDRVELFEKYCLPSVQGQTLPRGLFWIVYFDPESPDWLKERIEHWRGASLLTPLFREEVPREHLLSDLRTVTGARGRAVVTTNLDNDDGLARNFSARVRAAVDPGPGRAVIYLDQGLVLGAGRTYLRRDTTNAFCSVAEPWDDPVTCWSAWHTELERHMPVVHLDGAPGWVQVIHDRNVSNRVRGRLTTPSAHAALFPGLLDDVTEPSLRTRVAEALLVTPARVLRETLRALAKRLLLRVGGRDALVRVHAVRNAVRHRVRRSPA